MKRWVFIAALLLIGLGIFAWSWFSEPRYGGKKLSAWLNFETSPDDPLDRFLEASNALTHFDARGVPVLLELMRARDSSVKEGLYQLLNKQSLVRFRYRDADDKHQLAAFGFSCLKTNADSACPQLTAWLFATNDPDNCARALAGIGAAGIPAINTALTNANAEIQRAAVYASFDVRTNVLLTNMFLAVTSARPNTAVIAAHWIKGQIPHEDYFNLLVYLLHRPDAGYDSASYSLREMVRMTNQWPRVFPHIAMLLTNSSISIQRATTNALIRIDPVRAAALGLNTNPPPPAVGNPGFGGRRRRQ